MNTYGVYDAAGNGMYFTTGPSEPTPPVGGGFIIVDARQSGRWAAADGALVAYVPTLVENQVASTAAAQTYFDGLFTSPNGFTWSGSLIQIDDDSRANISGAVNDALASLADPVAYPFQVPYWIAADNTQLTLAGPADMIAMGRAVLGYYQACRVVFRAIKASVAAVTDQAGLDAIDVSAGYPASA